MALSDLLYLILAVIAVVIISAPLLIRRHVKWFSSWNWVLYAVFTGVFVRAIYISLDYPSSDRIREVFLLDQPKDVLLWPMVVVLIGLTSMTVGYLFSKRITPPFRSRLFETECWNYKRFYLVIFSFLAVACISLWFIIEDSLVGSVLANLSTHRGITSDFSDYKGQGVLFAGAGLSQISCYLTLAKLTTERKMRILDSFLFMLSLGTGLIFFFSVSQRGGLFGIILSSIIIIYFLYGQKLTIKLTIIAISAIIIGLSLVGVMSQLRPGSGFEENNNIISLLETSINAYTLNVTRIDVSKTAHIMAAIPDRISYQWGKTILLVFVLWIPKALWPAKPFVNVDTIIGMEIYGEKLYGAGAAPPGLIAEMYMNFGYPGIIAGCFAIGYFLRLIDVNFNVYSNNRNAIILYVPFFMGLGSSFLGSSIANIILGLLLSIIPLYIALLFINKRPRSKVKYSIGHAVD